MNIQELAERALSDIRKLTELPDKGTIAGGSLSNLIWEYVSGNKAVINDIDIFTYNGDVELQTNTNVGPTWKKAFYNKKKTEFQSTYSGLVINKMKPDEYYYIDKVSYDGILNYIQYSGSSDSPMVVINSFDINCTQIAYSIEEGKFYWTKDFEDFLNTGQLKVVDLSSAGHTALRIVKKKHEMNAELDDKELYLLQIGLLRRFADQNRRFFTKKYVDIFVKYADDLKPYFFPRKADEALTGWLEQKAGERIDIFYLESNYDPNGYDPKSSIMSGGKIWDKDFDKVFDNAQNIYKGRDFLFWYRNIRNDVEKNEVWEKLKFVYTREDYIDMPTYLKSTQNKINFLGRLIQHKGEIISKLQGYTLSEQISIVDRVFGAFDKQTAIKILGGAVVEPGGKLSDDDKLLLELSIRKEVRADIKNIVDKVFENDNGAVTRASDYQDPAEWIA